MATCLRPRSGKRTRSVTVAENAYCIPLCKAGIAAGAPAKLGVLLHNFPSRFQSLHVRVLSSQMIQTALLTVPASDNAPVPTN
jgi:hypothetical protein